MAARPLRSISGPIVLSSVTVVLSVALLVGWIYVILRNLELTKQYVQNTWLLVGGVVSIAVIMTVLILFSVFLAREIREVRRQTGFLDSVTHELRSPLASLRLCLETMSQRDLDDAKQRELRNMMLHDVERLSGFVDDILEASRVGHGSALHAVSELDFGQVVTRAVDAVVRRHDLDPSVVSVDLEPGLHMSGDPTALDVAIKNLVDNAIKYSDSPVEVRVRARRRGDEVELVVKDRGIGIPKGDLNRILERFYRVPDAEVRARRGTGLGLFVVSAIVRNLGGKMKIHSEGPGQGTEARLRIPMRVKT